MQIVLLDLNSTLVENTYVHQLPCRYNIHLEEYRSWLIKQLVGCYVILITVRPERYRTETLVRIAALEGWQPSEAYFSKWSLKAPEAKERILLEVIYPRWGRHDEQGNEYLAIESNASTRAMYARHRIPTCTQEDLSAGMLL